jgi:hypothetical protein
MIDIEFNKINLESRNKLLFLDDFLQGCTVNSTGKNSLSYQKLHKLHKGNFQCVRSIGKTTKLLKKT